MDRKPRDTAVRICALFEHRTNSMLTDMKRRSMTEEPTKIGTRSVTVWFLPLIDGFLQREKKRTRIDQDARPKGGLVSTSAVTTPAATKARFEIVDGSGDEMGLSRGI